LAFRPAILDRRVLILDGADFLQALAERCEERNKLLRNPIIGIAACCARATSGHATIGLPNSLMNSRRLMGFNPSTFAGRCGVVRYSKISAPMSALGQKRTLKRLRPMSALPPKADIACGQLDVRFVP
jgi:hypothetical protein